MTAAFLRKDVRIAARAGAILPGVAYILFAEAIAFGAAGAWSITVGTAPTPFFWSTAVTTLASISFFLAALGPTAGGAFGAAYESLPELAESLASAPVSPAAFFLGKASLPVVQGLAVQLAIVPAWAFLVGTGVTTAGAALRAILCACAVVPLAAIIGVTRYQSIVARRGRAVSGFRRANPMQAGAGQLWILLAALFWSSQTFHAISGAGGTGPGLLGRAVDAVRPALPMLLVDGAARTPLFGLRVPPILFTPLLLGGVAAWRLGLAIAMSPRAEPRDRARALTTVVVARGALAFYALAALWSAGAGAASAIAALLLLVTALFGIRGLSRLEEARLAALPCAGAGVAGLLAGGVAGAAFWIGTAAICAAGAAALPPRREDDRRLLAVYFVFVLGIGAPALALVFAALGTLVGPLSTLAGVASCVSPFAAPLSLAHDLFGAVPLWDAAEPLIPAIGVARPWIAVPAFWGAIAAIAIWRGRRRSR